MARSIADPISRASSAWSAEGSWLATSNDVASISAAVAASGAPDRLTVGRRRLAELIDGQVVGDLEQPTRQLELGGVAVDVVERFDERVLRELLRGLAIAHHAVHEREHGPLVAADQLPERRLAPLLREDNDVGVGEIGEIEERVGHALG